MIQHIVFSDANFLPFAMNHRLVSFMLWTMGFVAFVASLEKQYLKQQFGLFCWVHMTLLVIVVSSHFIVNNILEVRIPNRYRVIAQLLVGYDLVLGASITRHLQRHFCLRLGRHLGPHAVVQTVTQKDCRGLCGLFLYDDAVRCAGELVPREDESWTNCFVA